MSEESKKRPIFIAVIVLAIIALGGWHYFCHLALETRIEGASNEYLRKNLEGSIAMVRIQPLTNLVLIQVERPVGSESALVQTMEDAFVEYLRRALEPEIERDLATVARSDIDLYAMLVPYHVSIGVTKVRPGSSRIVKEVQKELIRLGADIGEADGVNGPRTKSAIAEAQAQLGMARDGQASEELLKSLRGAEPARSK